VHGVDMRQEVERLVVGLVVMLELRGILGVLAVVMVVGVVVLVVMQLEMVDRAVHQAAEEVVVLVAHLMEEMVE